MTRLVLALTVSILGLASPIGSTPIDESPPEVTGADADGDGVPDAGDNCLLAVNADQRDTDLDGIGNACDADLNDDCVVNFLDLGAMKSVFFGADDDADLDGDGAVNFVDLSILSAGMFAPPGPSGIPDACDADPLNVIVIMTDDLDERSLSEVLAAGLMPNLAGLLVDQGQRFSESFVSHPLCCPSRATFLTGRYTHNTGVRSNYLIVETPAVLDEGPAPESAGTRDSGAAVRVIGGVTLLDDTDTLATRLDAAGYVTAYVGKYLNGYGQHPDLAETWPPLAPDYVPPGWTEWHALVDPGTYCVYDYDINHNGTVTAYDLADGQTEDADLYQTGVLANQAAQLIDAYENDPRPLFLTVMPLAPHGEHCGEAYVDENYPLTSFEWRIRSAPDDALTPMPPFLPSPGFFDDNLDKPEWLSLRPPLSATDEQDVAAQWASRLRSLPAVDRLIGDMIDALGPAGLANTVVLFTSDNGWLYGEHRLGEKRVVFEEAARVPLYVYHPDEAGSPGTRTATVLNNDLAPTILDLAGAAYDPADFDGRSFASLISDTYTTPWVDRTAFLLVHWATLPYDLVSRVPTLKALRTPGWLYVEATDELLGSQPEPVLIGTELYDMQRDPHQLDSLIREPGQIQPALRARIDELHLCAGPTCRSAETTPLDFAGP